MKDNLLLENAVLYPLEDRPEKLEDSIQQMLSAVKSCLEMDVVFLSEFHDGRRLFRYIESGERLVALRVDDGDPLNETYCKKIVDQELPEIIPDTRTHPITECIPVTDRLGIGAYIGVPLHFDNGEVFGTFCCYKYDKDPTLNQRDLNVLKAFSGLAAKLIQRQVNAQNRYEEKFSRVTGMLNDEKLCMHYQPIYNLKKACITGFESLARFDSVPYRTPDQWFHEAADVGMGMELELLAVSQVLASRERFAADCYLSINISPKYIIDGSLSGLLAQYTTDNLVLEITEHEPIDDYSAFIKALTAIRAEGVWLAIDDVGAGYSSLQHIIEIAPDIIKLDISLIADVDKDPRKYALAKSLCLFAKEIGCWTTAEGVETREQLEALRTLGVDSVQGYFIGRPMLLDAALEHEPQVS